MRAGLPLLALLFTMIVWGIGPVFIRTLSLDLGPADHLAIRYAIVAAAFAAMLAAMKRGAIGLADWPRLLLVSFLAMGGYCAFSAYGFEKASASLGSLVIGTQPLIIALLAALLGGERLTAAALAGLAVAFAGILVLFLPDAMGATPGSEAMTGAFLVFLAGVAWSLYVVASRPLIARYGPLRVSAWSMLLASLPQVAIFTAVSGRTLETLAAMSARSWAEMAYMAVLSTVIAAITWNYGASRFPAAIAGASLYLVPVIGVAAGALMLGEAVTAPMIVGGLLILLGVAVAQFWPAERTAVAGLAAVIFAVAMWGLVPVAVRYLLQSLSPEAVMVLRVYSSGLIAFAVLLFAGVRPIAWADWPRLLIAALAGNTGYQVLAHYGMTTVPAAWTGMIFGLEPVFIALFAVLLAGERLTSWLIAGIAVSLTGTAVLFAGPALGATADVGLFGLFLVTVSTMGWGIYTVVLRPLISVYGAFPLTCLTLGLSAFPMVGFMTPATVAELPTASAWTLAVAAFLVLFSTFGAVAAWNFGLTYLSSARAGMFLYVQPAIAALGGWLLLGERMAWPVVAGGILILAGVALAQWKSR